MDNAENSVCSWTQIEECPDCFGYLKFGLGREGYSIDIIDVSMIAGSTTRSTTLQSILSNKLTSFCKSVTQSFGRAGGTRVHAVYILRELLDDTFDKVLENGLVAVAKDIVKQALDEHQYSGPQDQAHDIPFLAQLSTYCKMTCSDSSSRNRSRVSAPQGYPKALRALRAL
jgi:hypothetical protein